MKNRTVAVSVVAAGILFLGALLTLKAVHHHGFLAGRDFQRAWDAPSTYKEARGALLTLKAGSLPPGGVVILGDSIVDLQIIPSACGLPVLNAGIGGAKIKVVLEHARQIVAAAKPSIVVLAVGVNDTSKWQTTSIREWRTQYRQLIEAVAPAKVVIVGVPPIEPGKTFSANYRPSLQAPFNEELRKLAIASKARFVPPQVSAHGMTLDGVHLNAEGRRRWISAVEASCPSSR